MHGHSEHEGDGDGDDGGVYADDECACGDHDGRSDDGNALVFANERSDGRCLVNPPSFLLNYHYMQARKAAQQNKHTIQTGTKQAQDLRTNNAAQNPDELDSKEVHPSQATEIVERRLLLVGVALRLAHPERRAQVQLFPLTRNLLARLGLLISPRPPPRPRPQKPSFPLPPCFHRALGAGPITCWDSATKV